LEFIDMSMRDQIAALMWRTQSIDAGTPQSVTNGRTLEAFADAGDEVRRYWLKQADAILEALPDMIAPLVWEEGIAVCPVTKNRYSASWYDAGDDCTALLIDGTYHCGDMSMTELKAAANTHHRAAIMVAFTGETQ
jgi:hypothetical protein